VFATIHFGVLAFLSRIEICKKYEKYFCISLIWYRFLVLRTENEVRVFQNRALRRILGPKREAVPYYLNI
jgi:hypothetical protein